MFDAYNRRARLAPVALAAAPAILLAGAGAWSPKEGASISAMVIGAIGIVTCGLVRAAGRRVEPALWARWGGPPTTRLLRFRNAESRAATQRLHDRVEQALGRPLPTEEEEAADPADADRRYEEAVAALRELTRKRDEFPLVAEENADYGFRRNCLGLRPLALGIAAMVVVVSAVVLIVGDTSHGGRFVVSGGAASLAFIGWFVGVRPPWVRSAADLYATRLLEATETLARKPAG